MLIYLEVCAFLKGKWGTVVLGERGGGGRDGKERRREGKRNRIMLWVERAGSPYQMASGHRNSVTVTL